MTEEVQNLAEVQSASAPEATAAPEVAQNEPEVAEDKQPEQQPEERKFSQAELDAMISKRLAREQRKWEREQTAKQARETASVPAEVPTADQFDSPQAYAQYIREEAKKLVEMEKLHEQKAALDDAYAEREEAARDKYEDFTQVAYNPKLPVTDVMAETIKASDIGPDIAYWLGSNPKEADRIARLSPLLQAREIGKVEAKLAENPPVKKSSSAPTPITPVTPRGGNARVMDTTDPRSIKEMSTSEWIEAERQRQIKKWESQHRAR